MSEAARRPGTGTERRDDAAFADLVGPFRRELQVHCYRLLGSLQDAEEAVQETLLSAWQGLPSFEGRSSVRTWLYRIATRKCLDHLRAADRRVRVGTPLRVEPPEPSRTSEVAWLQPYPDDLMDPAPRPDDVAVTREATSLAFVRALQLLPPRQRAALVLRDVIELRAAEVAAILETTEESVTSALKRARAAVAAARPAEPPPPPGSAEERRIVDEWLDAFSTMDVPRLVALLTEDAWVRMPPLEFEYQGREAATRFFTVMGRPGRGRQRYVVTRANGQPAFAAYERDAVTGVWHARGLHVMTLAGSLVSEVTRFEPALLAYFGMPRTLD